MDRGGQKLLRGEGCYSPGAVFLALASILIFTAVDTVEFIREGRRELIWIVLGSSAAVSAVILFFRRPRGFFSPAFSIPLLVYLLYLGGSLFTGRFTAFFSMYFCICGLAAMFFDRWKFLCFIALSNALTLALILAGIPMTRGLEPGPGGGLINWAFSLLGSLFMYLGIRFVTRGNAKSLRAEDSFKTLLSSTPDYIVLLDELHRITYISRAFASFARIEDPEMAVGRPLLDLFRDMDLKLKAAEILDAGELYEGSWELSRDGEKRYFRIISNRLLGDSAGLFISLTDISAVERARFQAEEAARAKSAFLANTSHEIRTPMNAILGMTEMILRKDISPEVYEDAQHIKQAGKNLLAIINDILDFSKIESGKLEIVSSEYRFDSLVSDVLSIMKTQLSEKRLCFITRIDGNLPSVLEGDEMRVRQVLLNILSNAVKYTRRGDICFGVSAFTEEADQVSLLFEVADTGVGIQSENMERLFEEFVQFDSRANRGVEGTGLGLAISRNLCRLMGGDIGAESVYGEGSVFRVLLPQKLKDRRPFAEVIEGGAKRVLICEERPKQGAALAYTLEQLGVLHSLAAGSRDMERCLGLYTYDFALIAAPLAGEALGVLKAAGGGTVPVFLPDFGEDPPSAEFRLLPMPVQPLSLARLLNGEVEIPGGDKDGLLSARFIAPRARLLVVDDIGTNLKVAEGLLAPYRAMVDTCQSGTEALFLVQEHRYDIIFMDHMMPGMDGIESTRAIRDWEAKEASAENPADPPGQVPIIALTANAISGMREMFLEKGFNDYLSKPIEIAKLNEIMERWIPRDKRERPELSAPPGELSPGEPPPAELPPIPGLDMAGGLVMTGGTAEGYRQVLALFRKDAEERLPLLRPIPDPEGLPGFITQVHALKSAAASIGAGEISSEAARLEAAGKAGDLALIAGLLPPFAGALAELAENIGRALSSFPEEPPEKSPAPAGSAGEKFARLREALEDEDLEAIDRLLEELEKMPLGSQVRGALEQISGEVLLAEFDKALKIIKGL